MLNYKQLFYFWNVAKFGGVIRAARHLNVTPQTVSGQIGELEKALGTTLFRRSGRRLEMTQAGELALANAEEIFQIGNDLEMMLRRHSGEEGMLFRVGVVDAVPKSMAYRLISAAFRAGCPVHLNCLAGKPERLFGELAVHRLDLVIADRPLSRESAVKGYNHELGRSSVAFCAAPSLAGSVSAGFPRSMEDAPLLLPGEGASLRGAVIHWFMKNRLSPRVVGEFDDTALMKFFGQSGFGVFPVPAVMIQEVVRLHGVVVVGRTEEQDVRYFAISHERRLKHPAVLAVIRAAKTDLFL